MILCGFDLEATGTDPWHDRIIEIALFRTDGRGYSTLVNPHRPIPPEATAVHGITDEDVADAPGFWAIATEVQDIIDGCVLVGYNNRRYDTVLLHNELTNAGERGCIRQPEIDLLQLWHRFEPRTLETAVARFAGQTHDGAHRAIADARALPLTLAGMQRELGLPEDIDELVRLSIPDGAVDRDGKFLRREDGVICFNIGQVKGRPVTDDPGFLEWMLTKDFSPETKEIARRLLDGEAVLV